MKRIKLFTIAVIVILAAMVSCLLCACTFEESVFSRYDEYSSAELYVAGDKEYDEEIDKINVDFIAGEVNVVTSSTATKISVTETRHTDEDVRFVQSAVINRELSIKFCKGEESTFNCSAWDKKLTITLPEKVYTSIECDTESAKCNISLNATTVSIDSVSGAILYSGNSTSVEIDTVSGNIECKGDTAGSVDLESLSGVIWLEGNVGGNLDIETTSGEVKAKGTVKGLSDIDTMSGNIALAFTSSGAIDIDTTSGNTVLNLSLGFNLTFSSTSGKVSTDLPCSVNNKTYTYGDGATAIDISSLSGGVKINKLEA